MERGTHSTDDSATNSSEAVADHLWEERYQVLYRSRLSSMYHRRRERFYDWMDRTSTAVALFAGSAAFASATNPHIVQIAGAIVTFAAAVSLVFGFADKARRHATLAESYKRIEAEVYRVGDYDYTEAQINAWRSMIAQAETNEPPILRPLVILCQNDIAVSSNQLDKVSKLAWHKRLLAHFFDFDVTPDGLIVG